jgi:hypothetical protein
MRTSRTSKYEISCFPIFVDHFCPPGSGSGPTDLIESGSETPAETQPYTVRDACNYIGTYRQRPWRAA